MIKLDDALLAKLDLGDLPTSHRRALLQIIYQELEIRVGTRLVSAMTSRQLSQFETFIQANDEAAARAFLDAEVPDHQDVVAAEFDLLQAEITAHVKDIRALSSAYVGIPIELPPHRSPWRAKKAIDRKTAGNLKVEVEGIASGAPTPSDSQIAR